MCLEMIGMWVFKREKSPAAAEPLKASFNQFQRHVHLISYYNNILCIALNANEILWKNAKAIIIATLIKCDYLCIYHPWSIDQSLKSQRMQCCRTCNWERSNTYAYNRDDYTPPSRPHTLQCILYMNKYTENHQLSERQLSDILIIRFAKIIRIKKNLFWF